MVLLGLLIATLTTVRALGDRRPIWMIVVLLSGMASMLMTLGVVLAIGVSVSYWIARFQLPRYSK